MKRLYKIGLFILLVSLLTPRSVFAQQHKIRFGHLFHEGERWQSGQVYEILQDNQGFMWFGTRDGLYKYDGYSLIAYKNDPDDPTSLSDNRVRAIHQDDSGAFWIGTMGGGLNRFVPETEHFIRYHHDPNDPQSLSLDNVQAIYEDRQGTLWVGTYRGLNRFNPDSEGGTDSTRGTFTGYQAEPDDPQGLSNDAILVIYEDQAGRFWIGTDGGGLHHFDRESKTFSHYRMKHGLPSDVVYGILEDDASPDGKGGYLWLSTNKGLSRFSPQTKTFKNYDARDGLPGNKFEVRTFYKLQSA